MDLNTTHPILTELTSHLPPEYWWLVHQKEENKLSLAKAFSHCRAEIDALLVDTGIDKETTKGFGVLKDQWGSYTTTIFVLLCHGSNVRVYYTANTLPYLCCKPAKQIKANIQITTCTPTSS